MDRHILGTFTNEEDTVKEVKRLINEEDYTSDELALVIDKHSDYDKRLNTLKEVQVKQVEVEDESVWEKIKDTFSFGSYDSQASHSILEDYGVPHEQAEHYIDALKDGEIILLANTDAPSSIELSEVNEEIVVKERTSMGDKNSKPLDEVNSEEENAIKQNNEDPKNVETSETEKENMGESIDPSQAEHTRKEDNEAKGETVSADEDGPDGEDLKQDKEEDPDLTGEEETVDKEESKHGHGNKIAKGVVRPEAKSPLNTDDKEEKDPSDKSDAPESDANYPEKSEDAGMKSEE